MRPDNNRGRKEARAKTVIRKYSTDDGAFFTDAVRYHATKAFAATVVSAKTGSIRAAASVKTKTAH